VFGIVTTRVVVTMTEPDFRARSGNHIDRDSKFARGRCPLIFRAGALSKRLLEIASTLYVYCVTLHHRMPLGEASRPVGVPITLTVSPRGNPPYSIAPYSSAMTVGRTRRICFRWLRPFTRCSRTSQTTRAVPHATYSRFGRCVRRQRQWTLGRCRRHWGRLVKSGR